MARNQNRSSLLLRRFTIKLLEQQAEVMTDSEILFFSDLFYDWDNEGRYEIGNHFIYGEDDNAKLKVYKVMKNHVAQSIFPPDDESSGRYELIGYYQNYRTWVEPFDENDYYQIGDIVSWNNALYINENENNSWNPDQIGWVLYTV